MRLSLQGTSTHLSIIFSIYSDPGWNRNHSQEAAGTLVLPARFWNKNLKETAKGPGELLTHPYFCNTVSRSSRGRASLLHFFQLLWNKFTFYGLTSLVCRRQRKKSFVFYPEDRKTSASLFLLS